MSSLGWKSSNNKYRLLFSLILLASGLFLPIWFFVVVALVGLVIFDYYFEPAGLFFIIEIAYGLPYSDWSPYPFLGTICFLLATLIVREIKRVVLIG